MESSTVKKPLMVSNIPKPSRVPVRNVGQKRTATEAQLSTSGESEVIAPQVKRPLRALRSSGVASVGKSNNVKSVTKPTASKPNMSAPKSSRNTNAPAVRGGAKRTNGRQQPTIANRKTVNVKLQKGQGINPEVSEKLEMLSSRIKRLESEKLEGETNYAQQGAENAGKLKQMEEELFRTKQLLADHEHRLEVAERSKASLQRCYDEAQINYTQEVSSLKSTLSQMSGDVAKAHCELEAVKVTRDKIMHESQCKSEKISELEQTIKDLQRALLQSQSEIRENETTRRLLHNLIQELKGNIRVFCRMRPLLPTETVNGGLDDSTGSTDTNSSYCSVGSQNVAKTDKGSFSVEFPDKEKDSRKITVHYTPHKDSTKKSSRSQQYEFEYDHVFGPDCPQVTVFSEISQLVQSALDGYNVCIFAYGQTGSGKTYTMEGPEKSDQQTQGMIPRALQQVFRSSCDLSDKGWEYKLEASFIEIYNETVHDLLALGKKDVKHEIKIDPKNPGEVFVTNITPVSVTSEEEVVHLLEIAAKNRAVAATECNERSSRSHCLFRLILSGSNSKTMETCRGTLNLVDLAGSERLGSSGNVCERLKETQSINKSLSNLGNVIMALANKEQHIPYRNSKLTYLLQNSLGGNSKTLMFVNVSPQPTAIQETLSSLRFASKVNQCHIGTARSMAK